MIGVVGEVKRSIEQVKDWVIKDLIRQQKPELDKKIDDMLKSPKVNQIIQKYVGIGKDIGGKINRFGVGLKIGKGLKMLRKLL